MLITHIKKWLIRIIILFTSFLGLSNSTFAQGPVISSVNINSCIGEIRISVTNGVLPYSFAWEDSGGNPVGGNSFLLNGIGADDYRVTVTDANLATITAVYTVTNPPDLVGNVVVNDVSCKEGADAQVVVTMANGNPDYAWVLTNSANDVVGSGNVGGIVITIGGLAVDNYQLIVTDEDGCAGAIAFNVTEPVDFLGASLVSQTDATCSDLANGSLEVTGTGGWGNYTYAWYTEPGAAFISAGASINGLLPGDYRVYITDDNGCVITRTYTIDSPDPIAITPAITDASCNAGSDGAIDITVIGGNGGYSYSWSNGASSKDISGLTAGDYTITITDNLGCDYSETFTVGEPNALAINPNITDIKCFGDNSGRIRTNPSGGTAPYTYSWSTGNSGKNLNNRIAGSYTVTVTDANGCTVVGTYTINEPAAALSLQSITNDSPSCFGESDGSLTVVMQGGTAPYSYAWSNGANTATANGLASGNYTITVTDNNGCTFTDNYTVTDPPQIIVTPSLFVQPTCNGSANGSITVLASNGTGPYTYNWNTGDVGATLTNIPAGTYTVTVTDNGTTCTTTQDVTLGQPDLIESNATVTNISCNGQVDGSITLATTGGTGAYTYLWNTGATTDNITALTAGNYSVTITDASLCSVTEFFVIAEPDPLTSAVAIQDVLCKGQSTGSIDLTPADGTAPYSFLWSNGATSEDLTNVPAGNYSVTITDASGCSIVKAITIDEPAEILALSGTATNVTCNGSANGSIDFEVTGGVAPYTYSWNTGAISQDLNNIAPGVYTVQVTDANGCIKFDSFTITQPAVLAVNPTETDITCNGANDGIINLNVSGGTTPYTYLWNDGDTNQNRNGLSAANYTVTVTDANGCQNVQNISISEPLVLSATSLKQDVLCFGDASGVANITAAGGTLPYSYSWSNGDLTEDLNGVVAGNYTVTITDANGCTTTETVQINEPTSALSFTPTVGQITCNEATDGAISLNVSGGTAPYTYSWSNGSTSQNLSALSPGTYSVIIRDANNCQVTGSYDITDPPILNLSGTETDITCFGANDGEIDITVSGGEAPYTFVWSNGDNTEDVSGLAPGAYTVQIIDNRGCSISKNFNLSQPTALNIAYTKSDVNCFGGNDGNIDLTVTGGTAPYSYSWNSGQAQADITDLVAGTYAITVTDGNGCQSIESIVIDEPAAALAITNTVTDLSCFGSNNGSVALVTSGGTAPYTYAWSNGKTTRDIFGLSPGAYQVTVTDANGCSLQETFNITMPTALEVTASTTNLSCNGTLNGAIDLTVSGGTAPYTYGWNNGDTTEDLTNISGGTYQVFITDANGCSLTRTYTITEPLALVANITKQDVTCFGQGDGDIDVTIFGGIAPYTYAWSNGAITKDLANISRGTYTLTVTDNNGCQTIETVIIDEPLSALAVSGTSTDVSCFGGNNGTVDLTVSGGTAPYTYAWNNGRTTEDVAGLTAGNYQVVVTDVRGCAVVVPFTIGSPTLMQANASITNITCNGADDGAIDLSVSGGTAAYTFLWSNGETTEDLSAQAPGNYSVQITDANGCSISRSFQITEPSAMQLTYTQTEVLCYGNTTGAIDITVIGGVGGYSYAWSNGASSEDLSNLAAGNYSVVVTDVNGCSIAQNIQITQPLAALSVTETKTNLTCFGTNDGTIDLTVLGGTAPYTFAWSNSKTTEDNFNIAAGVYDVTITDANGCSILKSYTISRPDELTLSGTTSNVTCFGEADGTINITANGGTAPYTFVWSNGAGTEDISGLIPGNYSVQITDANGCTKTESYTITEPTVLAFSHTKVDVSCFGGSDASINISIIGGTAPYTYAWSNGATSEDLSGISAGDYSVIVTDVNGCQISQTINIVEPVAALSAVESITNLTCFGANDGSIELLVTGGTAPYSYSWNTGASTEDIYAQAAGAYQVTITDANGCSIQGNYNITTPIPLNSSGSYQNITCNGLTDGSIDLTVTGGTAPYTYSWSNGETTEDLSNLATGSYQVQVTDANGCGVSRSFNITQPLPLTLNYISNDVSCFQAGDGNITTQVSGGTAPYTYAWSNGETTKNISALVGGNYELTVTDANGCQTTKNITISEPSSALNAVETITDAGCNGLPNAQIDLTVTGGTAPYNYLWSNGSVQRDLVNVFAGNYQILVTDRNGCTFSASYTIAQPEAINADFAITNTSCFGDADGSIIVTPSGGTAPYNYIWSNGATSKDLINVAGGTYNLTITDANNCSSTSSVEIGDSRNLNVSIQKTDVLCKGETNGAIVLNVTGGSGSYTYVWDNGSEGKVLNNLSAGVYRVLISDAAGCATTASIFISEPALALGVTVDRTEELACFGDNTGYANAIPFGGVAPYTYLWSNGARTRQINNLKAGSYTVSVTDAKGCLIQQSFNIIQPAKPVSISAKGGLQLSCAGDGNGAIELNVEGGTAPYTYLWSTGSTDSKIENLTAGDYTVRVSDAKGCITEKVFSVEEPSPLLIADARVNESQCFDDRNGSISLDISGGVFPYSYQWSNGATTKNLVGISAGTFTVQITDANGCSTQGVYTLSTPERFVSAPFVSEVSCVGANDASISLNIEGGIAPLTIQWNTGSNTEVITDLAPGQYNVLITDKKGCTIQKLFNIIEPLPLTLDAYIEDAARCNDPKSGRVNVIVSGGREPYTYRWNNGETGSELVDVLPGTYVVTVSDRYGCEAQGTYIVQQPEPLRIGLTSIREVDCENRVAGVRVKANVTGGFGNYTYNWSLGSSSNNEIFLTQPGRLNLEILDDRGCIQSKAIDISIPEFGEAEFSYNAESLREMGDLAANDPVNFYDESVGNIIDWDWEFGDGFDSDEIDPIHTYDSPGKYTVTLITTDDIGCTSSKTTVLEITEGYRIMAPTAFSPNGDGNNDFFRPEFLGLVTVQFSVFNTWGELVFSTSDLESKGWDGVVKGLPAENGNYVYKIAGFTQNGLKVERDGVFALIK